MKYNEIRSGKKISLRDWSQGREKIPPQDNARTAGQDASRKESKEEKFWEKVNRDGPIPNPIKYGDIGPCWVWVASKFRRGYGQFRFGGKNSRAHRVSWLIHNGEIANGLCALHKCDNPSCVNPSHLFLGTHQDNVKDMDSKKRRACGDTSGSRLHPERLARGDANGSRLYPERLKRGAAHHARSRAKLSEAKVLEIRKRWEAGGESQRDLAKEFGVAQSRISKIVTFKEWVPLTQGTKQISISTK